MTSNNIIFQLLTTLTGAFVGVGISLYFFRAQQQTDFNKVVDRLDDLKTQNIKDSASHHQRFDFVVRSLSSVDNNIQVITRDLSNVKVATDAGSVVSVHAALESLRASYDKLNLEVSGLSKKIIHDFQGQQEQFLKNIQSEFTRTVDNSKSSLEQALIKEISPIIPSAKEQKAIIQKLIELSGYAMMTMGKYQLDVVQAQSNKALDETGQRISDSMLELHKDVKEVQKKLDDLPLALTAK